MTATMILRSCGLFRTTLLGSERVGLGYLLPVGESINGRRFKTGGVGRPPVQGYAVEQRYKQGQEMRFRMESAGMIGDPYEGPRRWLTPLDLFHRKGWKEIKIHITDALKDVYSLHLCRKHLDNFKLRATKAEVAKIYERLCQAIAHGDENTIRKLATAAVLAQIKKEISARKAAGCRSIQWSLLPSSLTTNLVRARVLGVPENRFSPSFVQCTFLFRNKQRFSMHDAKGKTIGGSDDDAVQVADHWVFERLLQKENPVSQWRVAARLTLPPRP